MKYLPWTMLVGLAAAALAPAAAVAAEAAKETKETQARKADTKNVKERVLFDGKTLAGWARSEFEGEGDVKVVPNFRDGRGAIVIEAGVTLSGITWLRGGELPRTNYEISLEAMRMEGGDFFCGLTFPVGKTAATFVCGGWSGMVTGISSIDYADASENETTSGIAYEDNRWYKIRVRVTDEKLEAWVDQEKMADVELAGKKIALRPGEIQRSLPLGIATFMTKAAVRNVVLKSW